MSLSLQLGSALALLVVTLPTFWLASRLALHTSAPTVWLRRLLLCLVPVAGVSYLLFELVDVDDLAGSVVTSLLLEVAPPPVQSVVADVAAQFALFVSAAGVTLAVYGAIVPAIRRARELDLSTWTAVARLGRYASVLVVLLTVVFVPFRRMILGESLGYAPAMLVVLVLALPLVSPLLLGVIRPVRTPEPVERERLDRSCERVGLDVDGVSILTDADETLEIHVRGLPGRRELFVSEFALTAFDDETLNAMLAVNAGSVESHYGAIKTYPLLGFIVAGVGAFVWGSPLGYAVVIGLAFLLPLPVLWAARRAVRRADDYAADRLGRVTVADALERSATEQNLDIPSGGWGTILKSRPPLQERIDRLRDASTRAHTSRSASTEP